MTLFALVLLGLVGTWQLLAGLRLIGWGLWRLFLNLIGR